MLQLPDVTLIAFGSTNIEGMKRALTYSQKGITFGAAKLIEYPCANIDDWSKNIVFHLGEFVETPFALLVHPDGFVVNPSSWRPDFMQYDYIGAPWPEPIDSFSYRDKYGIIQRVGNSVSIRSKKLLDLPQKLGMEWRPFHGYWNEDGYISVNMRHVFEREGCRFAPLEVAKWFSRERDIPENKDVDKPFCFHMPDVPSLRGRNKEFEHLL